MTQTQKSETEFLESELINTIECPKPMEALIKPRPSDTFKVNIKTEFQA